MCSTAVNSTHHPPAIETPFDFVQTVLFYFTYFVFKIRRILRMEFFASAIDTLKVLVIALGAGLGVWGVINLLEGYGNDNPGAKSQGIKQFMAN